MTPTGISLPSAARMHAPAPAVTSGGQTAAQVAALAGLAQVSQELTATLAALASGLGQNLDLSV